MVRSLITGLAGFIIGTVAGVFFGYRAAVVDYVENDGATLEKLAESMYETAESFDDLPEEVQNRLKQAGYEPDSDDTASNPKGYQ